MQIAIDVSMEYELSGDCTACLVIEPARIDGQTVLSESLSVAGAELTRVEGEAGIGERIWARLPGTRMSLTYSAQVEVTRHPCTLDGVKLSQLHELPGHALAYLRPSRFCQSDMFPAFAARRFGQIEGSAKVAAIRDWVAREMTYVPGASNATTTVIDTFAAREGVCRDYAHMVCALARAAGIPARYVSAYGPDVDPPDFHAVAQVWIGDRWHIVDASGMSRPEELAIIAVGRDACDVAFMETVDHAAFVSQNVTVRRL